MKLIVHVTEIRKAKGLTQADLAFGFSKFGDVNDQFHPRPIAS